MAVPGLVLVGSAAIVAANPAAIVPIVAMYAINATARIAYETASYNVSKDAANSLNRIANYLNKDGIGIAEIMLDSENGINQLSITINNEASDSPPYEGVWSASPEEV